MTKSLINYLTYKTKNHWHHVDTDFQNGAGSVSLSLLPIMEAYTSFMNVCNQSPLRLPKMQHQRFLTLCWLSFSGWSREHISPAFGYKGSQYIQKRRWHTNVNILRLDVGYLNVTMNRIPDNQNMSSEPTGQAKPVKTHGLTGMRQRLSYQEAAGQVFRWVWNWTNPFLWSRPGQHACYPDLLRTPQNRYTKCCSKRYVFQNRNLRINSSSDGCAVTISSSKSHSCMVIS